MDSSSKTYFERQLDQIRAEHSLPDYHYIRVRQSKAFMEKHLSEKIELDEIAAAAFMSRFHFIRVFKLVYGLTPREFLRDLRIGRAKELLKAGMSASQVCAEVGYESLPTFSSAFRRGTGYSPGMYAQLNKSNPE